MSVTLDAQTFYRRAKVLHAQFKVFPWTHTQNSVTRLEEFGAADALVFAVGAPDDELSYNKSSALQVFLLSYKKTFLLGYEFPDTLMAITESSFVFLSSAKKGFFLI